jgi:hypothetical protein
VDRLIAAANSPAGRRLRLCGGALAILTSLSMRGLARYLLALAGILRGGPAAFGVCL